MLWLFLRYKRQITLDGTVGKCIDIGGGEGGVVEDGGSPCTGAVASSGTGRADSGAGSSKTGSSGCTGGSGRSGGSGSLGTGSSGCETGEVGEAVIDLSGGVTAGGGITSVTGIVCGEVCVFARTGVGGDGGDNKEDCGSLQKGGERRRVVSLSSSLTSSTSQRLFPALHERFAGGESGGDGDSGSCNGCGGLGSKGVLR
jgi:hypothetical protein